MWSEGISDGDFSKKEILDQFKDKNIEIPECFLEDFQNTIIKMFYKKYKNGV